MEGDLKSFVDRAATRAKRARGIDAFEVRADLRDSRRIVAANGAIRASNINRVAGLGIRVFSGGGTSYAYANEIDDASIERMIERAADLARVNGKQKWRSFAPHVVTTRKISYRPQAKGRVDEASAEAQLELLNRAESAAREIRADLSVQTSFGARTSEVVLADSAGSWVEVGSLLSTLLVQSVAKDGGRIGDGAEWRGGERGLGDYEDEGGPEALGRACATNAVEALDAVDLPAGRMRALTDPHLSGLLAHESFGHLTEYDLVASGWSVLKDRLGEALASPNVTIRDAPVVESLWKRGVAVPFDEEGTPGGEVTLLDKGTLSNYMHTRDSAISTGNAPTGNARALDARHPPIVRMRNTFFDPGSASFDEALEALGTGVYLIGGRGGSPRSDGSFMFTSKRGYLVENGEVTKPIRSVSIHGGVLDFLRNVELTTRDFEVHTNYFGGCGKWDQSFLHVGTGGPHVLVSDALVGGQSTA